MGLIEVSGPNDFLRSSRADLLLYFKAQIFRLCYWFLYSLVQPIVAVIHVF